MSKRCETINGTAKDDVDYFKIDKIVTMNPNQHFYPLDIEIKKNNTHQENKFFFVRLFLIETEPNLIIGSTNTCSVILNKKSGKLSF